MSRKKWATISEETIQRGIAAWNFLRAYVREQMGQSGVRLIHGSMSKYAVEMELMFKTDGSDSNNIEYLGFCLGSATWGALFWPVCLHRDGPFDGYYLDPDAQAEWVHILRPQQWFVMTHETVLHGERIYMVSKATLPLLMRFMEVPSNRNSLTVANMLSLAEVLQLNNVDELKKLKRDDLFHTLLDNVGQGDQEWISKIKASKEKVRTIGDTLDEYILSEMPLDEQRDFKEVAIEAEAKQKAHWTILEQKEKQPKAKAKRKAKAKVVKPKAKAGRFLVGVGRKRKRDREPVAALEPPGAALEPPHPPSVERPLEEHIPSEALEAPMPAIASEAPEAPMPAEHIPSEDAPEVVQALEAPHFEAVAVPPVAPLEAEELVAPEALGLEAPPVAEAHGLRGPRGPGRGYVNVWEDVQCPDCSKICGQIKLDPTPGSRDPPTWYMRVCDPHGVFPSKGPFFKRRVARLIGEGPEGPTHWVMENKRCCV